MLKKFLLFLLAFYLIVIVLLYLFQEKLLFFPTVLPKDYPFKFANEFEEINIKVDEEIALNTLLFKSNDPKGVVLFFHGNGGAIHGWWQGADIYVRNNYDVMYVDYRGYGKSDGKINSEKQLVDDAQKVYDFLKEKYAEETIIVSGTSIGTGIAAQIAVKNNPKLLILNSPYASLKALIKEKVLLVPSIIMKYQLETKNYIKAAKLPIFIFHGEKDTLIPSEHAQQLKAINNHIELQILKGVGHNNLNQSAVFRKELTRILR